MCIAWVRSRTRLPLLAAVLLVACTTPDGDQAPEPLAAESVTVRWGTYFGMCAGYCRTELEIRGSNLRLTRQAWDTIRNPTRIEEQTISQSDRQQLVAKINAANLPNLLDTYGCPDCADGGGEWVELQNGAARKRVTFEYSRGPRELENALAELRALRQRFPQ